MTNSDLAERAARIMQLEEQLEEYRLDVKAAYDAAESAGYTKKALKAAIRITRMGVEKRAKHDAAQMDLELYLAEIEGKSSSREAA